MIFFSSLKVDRYGTNLEGGVRSEEHLDQPSGSADDWTSRGGHYFMEPYPTSGQLQTDVSISGDEEDEDGHRRPSSLSAGPQSPNAVSGCFLVRCS